MDTPREPQHKIQLWVSDELFMEMGRVFPHGFRRPVFTKLAEDLLQKMIASENQEAVCASVITGDLRLEYRE